MWDMDYINNTSNIVIICDNKYDNNNVDEARGITTHLQIQSY